MATADLVIKIVTDTSQMKGLDEAQDKFGKVGAGLRKAAVPAGIALAGIAAFGKGAVDQASRVEQAMGALDSVFGQNAAQVKAWADDSATAVGLSKASYSELATVMGAQLKNMGIPMDQVAGKTNELITLGADLAATYGGTTQEAVEALGSALRGETDPIERYGVSVKQADIAAQQAADGTDKLTGAAAKQAQAMALLKLVNGQTADAQGAFNREQDTAAHAAQVTAAQYEDMQATLGEALLPIMQKVTAVLGKLAAFMEEHSTATQVAIGIVAGLAAGILVLNAAMTVYTAVTTLAASATFMAWMAALGPILLVIAAVAIVVGIIVLLWKKSETFRTIVLAVWKAIKVAALATWHFIKAVALAVWDAIASEAKALWGTLKAIWHGIQVAIKAVADFVKAAWKVVWALASTYVKAYVTVAKFVFNALKAAVGFVVEKVRDLIGWIKALKVPGFIQDGFDRVKDAVQDVIDLVLKLIDWIRNIPTPDIHWPSPPGWLDKVIPGSFSAAPPTPGVTGFAAPGVPMARASSSRGATVNITVTGAIDPEATARQIQRILGNHNRRVGLAVS